MDTQIGVQKAYFWKMDFNFIDKSDGALYLCSDKGTSYRGPVK